MEIDIIGTVLAIVSVFVGDHQSYIGYWVLGFKQVHQ